MFGKLSTRGSAGASAAHGPSRCQPPTRSNSRSALPDRRSCVTNRCTCASGVMSNMFESKSKAFTSKWPQHPRYGEQNEDTIHQTARYQTRDGVSALPYCAVRQTTHLCCAERNDLSGLRVDVLGQRALSPLHPHADRCGADHQLPTTKRYNANLVVLVMAHNTREVS